MDRFQYERNAIMGSSFISAVLWLCRIFEKRPNYRVGDIIFLSFGTIFFTIQGLLIFGFVEQFEDTFVYFLGALSIACAAVFALELMLIKRFGA